MITDIEVMSIIVYFINITIFSYAFWLKKLHFLNAFFNIPALVILFSHINKIWGSAIVRGRIEPSDVFLFVASFLLYVMAIDKIVSIKRQKQQQRPSIKK